MKKGFMFSMFCLLLGMVFVSESAFAAAGEADTVNEATTGKAAPTATVKAEEPAVAEAEDAALEAEVAKIFGRSDWLAAKASSETSTVEFAPSTSFFCNQGARCTYKKDPACGPEGFCNLPSNCCMCY